MTERSLLRDRLLEMRRQLLDAISDADEIEVAWLSAIAGINATLAALDEEAQDKGAVPRCPSPVAAPLTRASVREHGLS